MGAKHHGFWAIGLFILMSVAPACDDDEGDGTGDTGTGDTGTGDTGTGDTGTGDTGTGDTGTGDTGTGDGGDATGDMVEDTPPADGLRDFSVAMTGMTPHVGQFMEFRIIDADGVLVARGLLDPLPDAVFTFEMLNAVPEGEHTLDFTADLNGNGDYDAPPADHAWSLPIPADGEAAVEFAHSIENLVDIGATADSEGLPFILTISSLSPHLDQRFELRVIDTADSREVARYVLDAVGAADFAVTIPGVIEDGAEYQVDFTADLNENGSYDAPPADHAWRLTGTADSNGLELDFTHNTTFTDVGF